VAELGECAKEQLVGLTRELEEAREEREALVGDLQACRAELERCAQVVAEKQAAEALLRDAHQQVSDTCVRVLTLAPAGV